MGSSPRKRQTPAMPGPARLVRRSILAAERTGLSTSQARVRVLEAVLTCRRYLDVEQDWLAEWMYGLVREAVRQAGVLPQDDTTRKDTSNGHTTSTGRAARPGPGQAQTGHDT